MYSLPLRVSTQAKTSPSSTIAKIRVKCNKRKKNPLSPKIKSKAFNTGISCIRFIKGPWSLSSTYSSRRWFLGFWTWEYFSKAAPTQEKEWWTSRPCLSHTSPFCQASGKKSHPPTVWSCLKFYYSLWHVSPFSVFHTQLKSEMIPNTIFNGNKILYF